MAALIKKDKPVSTAIIPWEEELAKQAQEDSKAEKVGGNFFSTKGGTISFNGNEIGHEMDVVVAGSIYDRAYYPGAYGDAKTPDCYSLSRDGIGMVPHADVKNKQHDSCDACPHNQFGSAKQGKGKACREYRRLALISADDLKVDEVPEATIGLFKVPPTGNKAYAEYVRSVAEVHKRPLWAMITNIKVVSDPVKQIAVSFKAAAQLTQEIAMAVKARTEAITNALMAPYPVFNEEAKPAAPAKPAKFAKKAA